MTEEQKDGTFFYCTLIVGTATLRLLAASVIDIPSWLTTQ
jgi:hypothetical protein